MFSAELYERTFNRSKMSAGDILCTLTHLTALSIAKAYRRFVLPDNNISTVLFSGGGTKNEFLMELIRAELSGLEIKTTDEFGVPSSAREAMSFAILGNETLSGRPSNVPEATGATHPAILGSITPYCAD